MKNLNNSELLVELKNCVKEEKNLTHQILCYLREVEIRRLHLEKGFSSLFVFCTEYLEYSEPEAQVRIQAMRLMKSVPEIEKKIESGELSLSVAAQAQSHFRKEEQRRKELGEASLSQYSKIEVLEKLSNSSYRDSQKTLAQIFPEVSLPKDIVKPLTETKSKMEFVASHELIEKLEILKNKLSHKNPYGNLGELIELLADLALEKLEPKKEAPPHGASHVEVKSPFRQKNLGIPYQRTYLSKSLKQAVWQKSKSQCTYQDKTTGKQCSSTYQLEIDHKIPIAKGGTNSLHNLRLLCRGHNQYLINR